MKINDSNVKQNLQKYNRPMSSSSKNSQSKSSGDTPFSPKDKVEIHFKKMDHLKVQKNDPTDPMVSAKVLNSLNSKFIDFSQKERDTISTIMQNKAEAVNAKRSASKN